MRPNRPVFFAISAAVIAGCTNPLGAEWPSVDKPPPPLVYPDSVKVGEEREVAIFACVPQLSYCIAAVRDLGWAARPANVVAITGTGPGQIARVRGLSVGTGWVIATGSGGSDSSRIRVVP